MNQVILKILRSPNIATREHVYRYYDTEVMGNTVIRPGEADAGLLAPIRDEKFGIALSVDSNPFYSKINPYWGGATAVAEAMRNVAAIGAMPWALTDCLNFGNPEKPEALTAPQSGSRPPRCRQGTTFYRVLIGSFATKKEAERNAKSFRKQEKDNVVIYRE